MNYSEVLLTFSPYTQVNEDILIALLTEKGFDSFWQNDENLKAYIPSHLFSENVIQSICKDVENMMKIEWTVQLFQEQNWNEIWEKNFPYLLINEECLIRAPFHNNVPKAKYEIIIEPKMSFGTGHHATTSLMIELILKLDLENKIILDMGCGTGILAILASLKNSKEVVAIDFDNWAYENSIENIEKNKCLNVKIIKGDASCVPDIKFDAIFANINRNVLLEDMKTYYSHLSENGILILSGIMFSDKEIIWNKAKENLLFSGQMVQKNEWIAAVFSKSNVN